MIVYCITNKINNKKYIGMTSRTLDQRWNSHCSSARNGSYFRFHCAIKKYGEHSFDRKIIHECSTIEECRLLEENEILKNNTLCEGYNAKPGGGGGWIVKPENFEKWKQNVTNSVHKEKNPRWSGFSDEFILMECVKIFYEYEDKTKFSFRAVLDELRTRYDGIPKYFSKNRFSEYQNSFKIGLSVKLGIPLDELLKLCKIKTKEHRLNLSKSISGRKWYSNDALKISKQLINHPGDGWIHGRKYGNKN